MARQSAITPAVVAVLAALNDATLRALCPGGVHRGHGPARVPPYLDVVASSEDPLDTLGELGSTVTLTLTAVTSGAHPEGEAQAVDIIERAIGLAEDANSPAGWDLSESVWRGTTIAETTSQDGLPEWRATTRIELWLNQ